MFEIHLVVEFLIPYACLLFTMQVLTPPQLMMLRCFSFDHDKAAVFIELCTQVFINVVHVDGLWGLHMFAPKNSVPHLDAVSSDSLIGNNVVSWWRNSERFSSWFLFQVSSLWSV